MNNRGQFSIIAAMLVAVVIIATVVTTYTAIRYDQISDQPQVLSAVDETNFALKQLLSFTVGYYGSILQVTGNTSYAQNLAESYLQSGLQNIADIKPDWGLSFSINSINLQIDWFLPTSNSSGQFSVSYDLAGLGFYNLTYTSQSSLDVQVLSSAPSIAQLSIRKEGGEPLTTLSMNNFKFYRYVGADQDWELVSPTAEPVIFANGTYSLNIPSGVDVGGYLVQVEDTRGIMTVASSFSHYTSALSWSSIFPTSLHYVDQLSDLDSSADKGTHSNFTTQKTADSQFDTLTEANTGANTEHYIDQLSDVDSSADKGTHSTFNNQKAKDNNYDTLTEANTAQSGTEILRPTGTGSSTALSHNTGSSNWACVDETPSDSDTTYVYTTSTSNTRDSYATQDHAVGSGTINSVTVHLVAREQSYSTGYGRTVIRTHSTNYESSDFSLTSSYAEYSKAYTTNPNTGVAWTWAEVDALECGVTLRASYGGYSRCTQVWVEVDYTPPANYQLDLEEQFTGVDYSQTNEYLCIYAGTLGSEPLSVQIRFGSSWITVIPSLQANTWNNVSISAYLTGTPFTIRFLGTTESGDTTQNTWQIDAVLLHTWTVSYELDLEEQFTSVDFSQANEYLCLYAGNLGSEALKVDVRSGSSWVTILPSLQANQWNNVSVSTWLTSSTFTIRFKGSVDPDTTLDTWQIDAVLLRLASDQDLVQLLPDSTFSVEWLQNGTMRWLGENLQLDTSAKPIPPLPVRAIHLNQTIGGLSREVPFQVEDWGSSYRVPLGLTSNTTVFSNRQMIVFLLNTSISEFTLWWDGRDIANQTSFAFTNKYFTNDNPDTGFLSNGVLNLNIEIVNIPADNANVFRVNSTTTSGLSTSTAKFMRINTDNSTYGAGSAFVIHHGVVRDVVQQEAEWSDGAINSPNLYANIVLTLPAGASYYTYQLRLMFTNSTAHPRTITDLCPIQLSSPSGSPQIMTENGTAGNTPIVVNGTGTFPSYGSQTTHHWSQFISGQIGTGIMFTNSANQQLYAFDSMAGGATGALNVSVALKTIEMAPVTSLRQVTSFTTSPDLLWNGAVATFDATKTPIYKLDAGKAIGLWLLVEYPPQITVTAQT